MKDFLLILLGKGINDSIDDSVEGVFKSECYYDWIKFKILSESTDSLNNNSESLLVASYNEEIKSRQEAIDNGLHVQQGIIALPADDVDEENSYNNFLDEVNNANIVFISFINIPSWAKNESEDIISSKTLNKNLNEVVKMKILEIIDKSSMRLFYSFDHNDFAIICNGKKTELKEYLKILEKIKNILLKDKYFAVHDITTIYGYKSMGFDESKTASSISALVSISGQDITLSDTSSTFKIETIGRYDHLSGYKDITWHQLSEMSKKLHKDNIITSRVHIGCELSIDSTMKKYKTKYYEQNISSLYYKFENMYRNEIYDIDFDKLVQIYGDDINYVASIKLIINEIRLAISTMLRRGFSKYNSVCYIESYMYFVKYIKEKVIGKFCNLTTDNPNKKYTITKNLAEKLVDISNSFYKSILTLDASIMHSERRFIMSDPYQLTLFDVPPKLIAYYTSISSEMAKILNNNSNNKYVFLITPDIKKDIYVESITNNRDIGNEINILVIHINERNIYNVTDTTKSLAHEIAHHVGQDDKLRKIRAGYIIKCYIALIIKNCLDTDLFLVLNNTNNVLLIIEKLSEDIFKLMEKSDILNDINQYYYMDILKEKFHSFLKEKMTNISEKNQVLYELLSKYFDSESIIKYLKNEKSFFAELDNFDLSSDNILKEYVYRRLLENTYDKLEEYFSDINQVDTDMECVQFIFKEGYADIQMILLTENLDSDISKIIDSYSQSLECVKDKTDEMMRKCAVVNALLKESNRTYDEIIDLDLIKNDDIINQAYYLYICKQATLYFEKVKDKSLSDRSFDYSKTSLFKTSEISKIMQQVDNTIANYVENIL